MKKIVSKVVLALAFLFVFVFAGKTVLAQGTNLVPTEAKSVSNKATKVAEGDYVLVTDESELVVGRNVIIVASSYNYAASYKQSKSGNTYYRSYVSVTKKTSNGKTYITPSSSVATFTLGEGSANGTYSFYDEYYDGYLCAYSNSYDWLRVSYGVGAYSSFTIDVTNGQASIVATQYSHNTVKFDSYYGRFSCYTSSSSKKAVALYQEYVEDEEPETPVVTTVPVTGVSLSVTSGYITAGQSGSLTATVTPSNATNQAVTWTSSNTAVATVSSEGVVTGVKAGSAVITVKTVDGGYTATCNLTVYAAEEEEEPETPTTNKAAWTIMIYLCGADLESDGGYATSDINEILSVAGQPDDVNIIIQTGGAKSWSTKYTYNNKTYTVDANYTSRFHVANKKLVLDEKLSKANMGLQTTFQSFLEWGLTEYPAEKTGVIMWNHGGAMRGVCYDENYDSDSLLNSEVKGAVSAAFKSTGRTEKLEFIGYDACLMSVQDIAEFNSQFFNYMIASEESEAGYGWDYDTWVDDLYRKSSTTTILKAIVDGFIADNGGVNYSRNNQTLAYLNLNYMAAYKTAWENMATAVYNKLTSSNKSSFKTLVSGVKYYGDSYYKYYGIFDAKDFINKLSANSTFNPGTTIINNLNTAFSNLVEYSSCGKGAGNSNGLCMFFSIESTCYKGTYYTTSETNFTNWRKLVSTYGA